MDQLPAIKIFAYRRHFLANLNSNETANGKVGSGTIQKQASYRVPLLQTIVLKYSGSSIDSL
jgi:hypothetical protein